MPDARTAQAIELMTSFAERTGLHGDRPARRYLWTDAFAVCNFIGLARATGEARFAELAVSLVHQVHHELGRHRAEDQRTGWISGLDEAQGEAHPTVGGLRIGKPLAERAADEPLDPELEWERDGQYFHYLTKWMHALDQMTRATGRPTYNQWARELLVAAHRGFVSGPDDRKRMAWKLSIDLSRPLVPSMGQHDPLDGLVTCLQLDGSARDLGLAIGPGLAAEAADFASMLTGDALVTADPLGLGGLLFDACRLAQLAGGRDLIAALLAASLVGLRHYATETAWRLPAGARLGFRELGLGIGLAAVPLLEGPLQERLDRAARARVTELARYVPLRGELESFWRVPDHRRVASWVEHADINDVMLATSLLPDGFLQLGSPRAPVAQLGELRS